MPQNNRKLFTNILEWKISYRQFWKKKTKKTKETTRNSQNAKPKVAAVVSLWKMVSNFSPKQKIKNDFSIFIVLYHSSAISRTIRTYESSKRFFNCSFYFPFKVELPPKPIKMSNFLDISFAKPKSSGWNAM